MRILQGDYKVLVRFYKRVYRFLSVSLIGIPHRYLSSVSLIGISHRYLSSVSLSGISQRYLPSVSLICISHRYFSSVSLTGIPHRYLLPVSLIEICQRLPDLDCSESNLGARNLLSGFCCWDILGGARGSGQCWLRQRGKTWHAEVFKFEICLNVPGILQPRFPIFLRAGKTQFAIAHKHYFYERLKFDLAKRRKVGNRGCRISQGSSNE